jgi:hypothetical protein
MASSLNDPDGRWLRARGGQGGLELVLGHVRQLLPSMGLGMADAQGGKRSCGVMVRPHLMLVAARLLGTLRHLAFDAGSAAKLANMPHGVFVLGRGTRRRRGRWHDDRSTARSPPRSIAPRPTTPPSSPRSAGGLICPRGGFDLVGTVGQGTRREDIFRRLNFYELKRSGSKTSGGRNRIGATLL